MLIHCKICQREFLPDPKKKLHGNCERGLCPECLFLCRQQNQPPGPEKMILRILREYLVRHGVADEKSFVRWNDMPASSDRFPSFFWTESIFGFFLERRYEITYLAGGSRERVAAFNQKLCVAFDPKARDLQPGFPFDAGHMRFYVKGIAEVKRPECKRPFGQFRVTVSF